MLRLALKNLQGRKAYSAIIIFAVAAAALMALLAVALTGGVRQDVENKRRMLGPDLALAPPGNKEKGHIYLSKGLPDDGALPPGVLEQLGTFPEVEAFTPQKRLGHVTVGGIRTPLIGFDPATDFVVLPWLVPSSSASLPGRNSRLFWGALTPAEEEVPENVQGMGGRMGGRLLKTGAFMDNAVFVPRPAEEIATEPSWVLLRLRKGALLDVASNRLSVNIPGIEVLPRPEMFKSLDNQLYKLIDGGAFGAAALLAIMGALFVTGSMFALMTHERKREFGLIKSMGARNTRIFKLIMTEACLLGGAGAVLGACLAGICLPGLHFAASGPPLARAADAPLLLLAAAVCIMAVAVLTALWPALTATRLEPYAAIRSGE